MKKHYIILYEQLKVKTKRYLKGGLVTNKFSSSYKDYF